MNTGDRAIDSHRGLITTLAASVDGKPDYVLEGSVFVAGALVQWLRDELGMISTSAESESLALSVSDTCGAYIVPAFVGLGAPYWDSEARGIICGLTRGVNRAHIVRAALESIAYQVFDLVHSMERDLGENISGIFVDGGASGNEFLMRFQADILGKNVSRPAVTETTALGAAYLAGLSTGIFANIGSLGKEAKAEVFEPSMEEAKREELIEGWKKAVLRARYK